MEAGTRFRSVLEPVAGARSDGKPGGPGLRHCKEVWGLSVRSLALLATQAQRSPGLFEMRHVVHDAGYAERARVRLCRKRIDDFLLASDFSSLGSLSAGTNSLERVFMPWPF